MRVSLQPVPLLVQGQIRAGCCSMVPCQRRSSGGPSGQELGAAVLLARCCPQSRFLAVPGAVPSPVPPLLHPGWHLCKSRLIPDYWLFPTRSCLVPRRCQTRCQPTAISNLIPAAPTGSPSSVLTGTSAFPNMIPAGPTAIPNLILAGAKVTPKSLLHPPVPSTATATGLGHGLYSLRWSRSAITVPARVTPYEGQNVHPCPR